MQETNGRLYTLDESKNHQSELSHHSSLATLPNRKRKSEGVQD
jgi:hypothetical protein